MGGAVNVTVHKNVLKNDGSTYAKVKRATADMGNVIAAVLKKNESLRRSVPRGGVDALQRSGAGAHLAGNLGKPA